MTDYRRMEWQYWANRCSVWVLLLFILLDAEEVKWAFKYNFPWWDDVLLGITLPLTFLCWFVKRHTDQYRFDL